MSRWKMYKLGLVHFWLYDQEEFLLENGRILLRGNNGAGKSITTQSFIPFILDGDRHPARLDPFGNTAKKMDFYLLGEDEETKESTGYLYLEFKKENLDEYLTIGIGMRAQRGAGIEFWGFCLNDGRRIGPNGVQLCEKIGGHLVPLSRQKMKNLLADNQNWADTPKLYKELVNRRVFQFRDIRQYDQLIQMLLKVRKPKLSVDNFRPTALKEILNASLQVLTDEDLSAMADVLGKMDSLEDQLRSCRAAMKDAKIIRNEYTRYNQFVLGRKGRAYLEKRGEVLRLKNRLKDEEERCADLEKQLAEQARRRERSAGLCQRAKAQRAAMGNDDLSAKQDQLTQTLESCTLFQRQLEQGKAELEKLTEKITRRETELRELTRQRENARDGVRLALRDLDEGNAILGLGQEHTDYIRAFHMERSEVDNRQIRAALRRRRKQIDEVLLCMDRAAQAGDVYDSACQALDESSVVAAKAASTLRDAELQEQGERDRLLETFAQCQARNVHLRLTEEDMLTIRRAIGKYSSPADWSIIRNRLDDCARKHERALTEQKIKAQTALENLRAEKQERVQMLEQVKSQSEPIPPRSAQIQATRVQLAMRGVPCAAFYEGIDFAPDMPQEARDLLEAQMIDAGLLDALVVSPEYWNEILELLEEYPDRFLLPGTPVENPITGLVPAGAEMFRDVVAACLRSISQDNLDAETALLPDGRFRCGLVRGYSRAETPAGYIGAAARHTNRARRIQEIETQLAGLTEQIAALQKKRDCCAVRLTELREEREQMPSAVDLDQALEMLSQAQRALAEAEMEKERRLSAERTAKRILSKLDGEIRAASAGLPYEKNIPAYEEAKDAAEEYQSFLETLENQRLQLKYAAQSARETEERIDEQREQADSVKRNNAAHRSSLDVSRAAAEELQAFLNCPENQARAKRLEELEREIDYQAGENHDAEMRCVRLTERINHSKQDIEDKKQGLSEAVRDEQDLERCFSEDLALGFSGLDLNQGLERCAREAADKMQASDRERTHEQVQESLRKNYQQHNDSISQYHPEIRLVFDPPAPNYILRQRLCITLNWCGKDISLYEFIQALQSKIDTLSLFLEEKDRELFENILTETISLSLRRRIEESRKWTESMTALMSTLDTSMGLIFTLDWKAKRAESGEELDTAQLVTLLNKDRALISREDGQRVSAHFRAKVKKARDEAYAQGEPPIYADLIRTVLDYRNWYEFRLFYQRKGEDRKELTDRIFNRFSGGEKAMAMYVPLFAAVSAQYGKSEAPTTCPRLLALDEAFAGVDEKNIGAMFELVHSLDLDYIMNSQALWGCYACVDDLNIADLHRPANASVVTILRYRWNGQVREDEL